MRNLLHRLSRVALAPAFLILAIIFFIVLMVDIAIWMFFNKSPYFCKYIELALERLGSYILNEEVKC